MNALYSPPGPVQEGEEGVARQGSLPLLQTVVAMFLAPMLPFPSGSVWEETEAVGQSPPDQQVTRNGAKEQLILPPHLLLRWESLVWRPNQGFTLLLSLWVSCKAHGAGTKVWGAATALAPGSQPHGLDTGPVGFKCCVPSSHGNLKARDLGTGFGVTFPSPTSPPLQP